MTDKYYILIPKEKAKRVEKGWLSRSTSNRILEMKAIIVTNDSQVDQ